MYICQLYLPDHYWDRLLDEERAYTIELNIRFKRDTSLLGGMEYEQLAREFIEEITKCELDNTIPMTQAEQKKAHKVERKTKAKKAEEKAEVAAENQELIDQPDNPINQTFIDSDGLTHTLTEVLNIKDDVYKVERKRKDGRKLITENKWLLKRDAIRKIASAAGITDVSKITIFSPSVNNRYLVAFDVTVTDKTRRSTTMLGEASDENTKGIARSYKALTAERRGYTRAVLVHLGINNIYGEDEFIQDDTIELDEEPDEEIAYDRPGPDEFKEIAPLMNDMTLSNTKEELNVVAKIAKDKKDSFSKVQYDFLTRFYKKNLVRFDNEMN